MANIFSVTQNFENDAEAIEWAKGFVFAECETEEAPLPRHSREVESFDGVTVHYDFGADYYFFTENEEA
ncbi:hypothetical protein VCHA53O466_140018 [Vibrio chagasii]|nr:hypothetical protein VCHA53O466_140018 [Vibrio chagasii]